MKNLKVFNRFLNHYSKKIFCTSVLKRSYPNDDDLTRTKTRCEKYILTNGNELRRLYQRNEVISTNS